MLSMSGLRTFSLFSLTIVLGGAAAANTIDLVSLPGKGSNSMTGTNVGVVASPVWATPTGSGFEWISYGPTGCNTFVALTGLCTPGPFNPAGTTVTSAPTATFYQTFTVVGSAVSGTLDVWADDTAAVWLDTGTVTSGDGSSGGQLLQAANGIVGGNCAAGPIGCKTGMDAAIPMSVNTGTYTLVIDAYQFVGGSPFGIMYDGVLSPALDAQQSAMLGARTPEPASFALMLLGLAGLGVAARRRSLR